MLNAHRDNLGTMVKLVIFNELSNARNPNNMQLLHTLLLHSPEQAPKVRILLELLGGNGFPLGIILPQRQTDDAELGEHLLLWLFHLGRVLQGFLGIG